LGDLEIGKMEKEHENLHFEMRTSQAALDNQLRIIIADYNGIKTENVKIRRKVEEQSKDIREAKYFISNQKVVAQSV
jgi:hypothetical protein